MEYVANNNRVFHCIGVYIVLFNVYHGVINSLIGNDANLSVIVNQLSLTMPRWRAELATLMVYVCQHVHVDSPAL